MAVLSNEKKHNLRKFVRYLEHTIDDLIRDAPTAAERNLYKGLRKSVLSTGVYFYKGSALAQHGLSTLLGLHKTNYAIQYITDKKGHKVGIADVKAKNVIYIPARHLFDGDKLKLGGVSTIVHEWSHFPKNIKPVARHFKMSREGAEEFIADVMAAKVLKKTGRFTDAQILKTFRGRVPLFRQYNRKLDYAGFLARAITPKKEKVRLPRRRLPRRKRKPLLRLPKPAVMRRKPRAA